MMRVWKSLLWHLKEGYVYATLQRTCATRCGTQVSDKSAQEFKGKWTNRVAKERVAEWRREREMGEWGRG